MNVYQLPITNLELSNSELDMLILILSNIKGCYNPINDFSEKLLREIDHIYNIDMVCKTHKDLLQPMITTDELPF